MSIYNLSSKKIRIGKRNKYGAVKTVVDNITFDSKKEATVYRELKMMQKGKAIFDLKVHPRYPVIINKKLIGYYEADFYYKDNEMRPIIVDVKSETTKKIALYQWKKKCVEALYGIEILER